MLGWLPRHLSFSTASRLWSSFLLPGLYLKGQTVTGAHHPAFTPGRDDEHSAPISAGDAEGTGATPRPYPRPPLPRLPLPPRSPWPFLSRAAAPGALLLRSGGAPKVGRGRRGEGSPLPTAPGGSDMMTAGREGEGGPVLGVEPPGGWSLAAPPEPPARSRRVQSSASRCGSAAARSRRPSAARVPRPAGARYVLSPWRSPRSAGAGPPSLLRPASLPRADKPAPSQPLPGAAAPREPPAGRAGEAGGGLRIQVP